MREYEFDDDDDDRPTFPDDLAAQHRHLAVLLEGLKAAIDDGADGDQIGRLLSGLIEDVTAHFHAEESVMQRARYPLFEDHRDHHAKFVASLESLERECSARHTGIRRALIEQIESWYYDHQHTADADALSFAGQRG